MDGFDVIVIGGGIAGVSIAYELAAQRRVCLLEAEPTLAYHTTGRSAATWLGTYGNTAVRSLTAASRSFLTDPPDIFDAALVSPLSFLYVARPGSADTLRNLHAEVVQLTPDARLVPPEEAERINPVLRPGFFELGLFEPGALDVDVHELHSGYARGLRRRNGTVLSSAGLASATHGDRGWSVHDRAGRTYRAPVVVNAAGAWCDEVAGLFGAAPIGIRPLRRTLFTVPGPTLRVPLTNEIDDAFYFRPEHDVYLCSPMDETLQPPGDAKPDELEIARALDALAEATMLDARHVRSSWAGLRSFVADRTPVVGFDPRVEGLFWFAAQGGYGIQTAPALARTGAALIAGDAAVPLEAEVSPSRPTLRATDQVR